MTFLTLGFLVQKCFSYFSENVVFDELIEFILELIYTEP